MSGKIRRRRMQTEFNATNATRHKREAEAESFFLPAQQQFSLIISLPSLVPFFSSADPKAPEVGSEMIRRMEG